MPWKFDSQSVDIVFIVDTTIAIVSGSVELGDSISSDLSIDTGDRENESSLVDGGLRIIDGSI
jgi:hypothetical protein